jgi:hypothetical protein
MQHAAGLLELYTSRAVLRLEAAVVHQRAPYPRGGAPLAQHCAHGERLIEIAAGRGEIDRQIAIADLLQELFEAQRGAAVDLSFHRDPAIAAAPAGVGRALDDVEQHRRHRHRRRRRPHPERRCHGGCAEQDKDDDEKCAQLHRGCF